MTIALVVKTHCFNSQKSNAYNCLGSTRSQVRILSPRLAFKEWDFGFIPNLSQNRVLRGVKRTYGYPFPNVVASWFNHLLGLDVPKVF
ncbi:MULTISPECIES: hypothetical protein [Prochlorococcus]|uniref:hypothetical protein n=1 Tax=Prochlorococcus TaxID=1218 RepID=UPI0005338779|nr:MULTISPECIES: hypothetical protein [Prochlorococcus]KGG12722.1 hypothetical protein EV05_1940 [Prochlorococcus sp. MIT 0601]